MIPSTIGQQALTVAGEADYSARTNQIYGNQRVSGMAGAAVDFTLKGYGLDDIVLMVDVMNAGYACNTDGQTITGSIAQTITGSVANDANTEATFAFTTGATARNDYELCFHTGVGAVTRHIGYLTLTARFSVDNNWVLTPGQDMSIEVVAQAVSNSDANVQNVLDINRDRMMVEEKFGEQHFRVCSEM